MEAVSNRLGRTVRAGSFLCGETGLAIPRFVI